MKKTNLIWRLKEQPTTESLQNLVKDGILSKEEARQILFSLQTEDDRSDESLKSEIKFLRELIEKLSQSNTKVIEVIKTIEVPYKRCEWYPPYQIWCETTSPLGDIQYATTNAVSGGELTSFSSISTF